MTLNVLANKVFDYEDAANPSGEITLTVTATDDNTGMLTDAEDVTVTVTNVTFSTLLSTADVGARSTPAFGDVDGDGDMDLLVGISTGTLFFYRWGDGSGTEGSTGWTEVTGDDNNPFHVDNPFATTPETFDVGNDAAPAFGDVDNDGDDDLLVGKNDGMLAFYRWGTATDGADADSGKSWSNQTTALTGNLARLGAYSESPSFPAFVDGNGDIDMDIVVGNSAGLLNFFRWFNSMTGIGIIGWNQLTTTATTSNPFSAFDVGIQARPTFGDVDGDGDKDLVVGNFDGKLHFFRLGTGSNSAASPGTGWTEVTGTANPFDAPEDNSPFDVGSLSNPAFGDVDGDAI